MNWQAMKRWRIRRPAPDPEDIQITALYVIQAVAEFAAFAPAITLLALHTASSPTRGGEPPGFPLGFGLMVATLVAIGAILALKFGRSRLVLTMRERWRARLRSEGHNPERAAALVGLRQALETAGYNRRQARDMTGNAPADADIIAELLRRIPAAPDWRRNRRDLVATCATCAAGAVFGLLSMFAYDQFMLAFDGYELIRHSVAPSAYIALPLAGAAYMGLVLLVRQRRQKALRRCLEDCRDAGMDAGSAALLLLQSDGAGTGAGQIKFFL